MWNDLLGAFEKPNYSKETIDILRLIRSENIGVRTFLALINLFGDATKALENVEEFSLRGGKSKPIKVFSEREAIRELELLVKNNSRIITYKSPQYSNLLCEIPDFPPVLTCKGNIGLLTKEKLIAIVGARNASLNARVFASKIAQALIEKGYVIVSGLARGIDTAVHEVDPANTIAVMAGGIDHIYPPENQRLYEKIAAQGLIITEAAIEAKPIGQSFPQRNRLISGLCLGTVVVEASLNSGSLITARFALEQNREVFAVPGFPLDPRCRGTNKLLKEGAHLVESVEDIVYNLQHYQQIKKILKDSASSNSNFRLLNGKYEEWVTDEMRKQVISLLSGTPVKIEQLAKETNFPLPSIQAIILELELAGKASRHPGNKISLIYK